MQNVEATKITNPDANMMFKIMHAVLLSMTFHIVHELPKGFEQSEGALMIADTQRRV
jgi:hypothetical protein